MTDAPKISLAQQIEAVQLACDRQRTLTTGGTVKEMRPKSAAAYDTERLTAALRTLQWLRGHMDAVREFAELKPDARCTALEAGRRHARPDAGGALP